MAGGDSLPLSGRSGGLPRQWRPGSKSDAIDAHGLAEKLRTGQVDRRVYKDAQRFTALRDKARSVRDGDAGRGAGEESD